MQRLLSITLVTALVVFGGYMLVGHFAPNMDLAWARGWGRGGGCPMSYSGQPGGGDFQPQGNYRAAPGRTGQAPAATLSQERARDLAAGHLGPGLSLGKVSDGGSYFAFEVRNQDKVVDRLAVDKSTGLVRSLD